MILVSTQLFRAVVAGIVFSILWPQFHPPPFQLSRCHTALRSTTPPVCKLDSMPLTYSLLALQNADTSNSLIEHWENSEAFHKLAQMEGNLTVARDTEDGEKLQLGIDFAKQKGVIDPNYIPEPYLPIDVLGKTPEQVAEEIIASVTNHSTRANDLEGSVVVLCGLSGTGKVRYKIPSRFETTFDILLNIVASRDN